MNGHLIAAGLTPQPNDLIAFHGLTWSEIVHRFRQLAPNYSNQMTAKLLSEEFESVLEAGELRPIQGASSFVREASKHFRCVVVSSSPRTTILSALEELALLPLIEFIVGEDDIKNSKPDPEPYLLALKKLDLSPTETITFEDSDAGITSSMMAGIWTIGINRRKDYESQPIKFEPHLNINSYSDLPPKFCEMLR